MNKPRARRKKVKKEVRLKRERDQCVHIAALSICVRAYACLQLCVFLLLHMRGRMSEKQVSVERRSRGRQRALYGWRTERGDDREETGIRHNSGSVSLLERSRRGSA